MNNIIKLNTGYVPPMKLSGQGISLPLVLKDFRGEVIGSVFYNVNTREYMFKLFDFTSDGYLELDSCVKAAFRKMSAHLISYKKTSEKHHKLMALIKEAVNPLFSKK